ncbi:hypothetical protein, partial [Staphylococcus pseudintermedius]|uniref:hypothetical protein n=1 Tax=Staphylococcus pseudintermedius TaxID=283734 RepID=UPI0036F44BCD
TVSTDNIDYQLNPIYCPYFNISYRKRRKMELSTSEFITLISGSVEDYQNLIKSIISKRLKITDFVTQPLFPDE